MKKALKISLIIVGVIVLIEVLSVVKLYMGVDYEERYKELFDKTFDGNYILTVTESGTVSSEHRKKKLPMKYKSYELKYYDKDGNERNFGFSGKRDYPINILAPVMIPRWALYQGFDADKYIAEFLESESKGIFLDQLEEHIGGFFDSDLVIDEELKTSRLSRRYNGDGFNVRCATIDIGVELVEGFGSNKIIIPRKSKNQLKEIISPETCMVLSKQEMKDYASQKTAFMFFTVTVTDEDVLKDEKKLMKAAEKYRDSAEEMMEFYCGLSDFGGSCQYTVGIETDSEDEDADGKIFTKYVCMGKEFEKIEGSTILNEVRKANGFDVSEMQ